MCTGNSFFRKSIIFENCILFLTKNLHFLIHVFHFVLFLYKGLMDYLNEKNLRDNTNMGKIVVLPSCFGSGPRSLKQNFLDAMVLVQGFG